MAAILGAPAAERWVHRYCGVTPSTSDCWLGFEGSFSGASSMAHCRARCARCARCRFVSFSSRRQDCSWFTQCAASITDGSIAASYRTERVSDEPVGTDLSSLLGLSPTERLGLPAARAQPPRDEDDALHAFAQRLAMHSSRPSDSERPLRIAVYGTSITAGVALGYGANHTFPRGLEARLRRRYGAGAVSVSTYGFNAASLSYMRHCVDSLLPEAADLYIVEYHEGEVGVALKHAPKLAELAPLVEALRARPKCPAVLLLSGLEQSTCVRPLKRMMPCVKLPRDSATDQRLVDGCLEGWQHAGRNPSCAEVAQPRPAGAAPARVAALLSPMQRLAAKLGVGHVSLREAVRSRLRHNGALPCQTQPGTG